MESINNLTPYMLTCKNMSTFTRYLNDKKDVPRHKPYKVSEKTNSTFIPYQEDKLFWILYYILNGYVEYNLVGSNAYTVEMETRIKWIEVVKENKSLFKEYKFTKVSECASSIMSEPKLSFKAFEMLCICFNVSFIMVKNRMYHKLSFEECEKVYIIHYVNEMFGCELIQSHESSYYETNRFEVQHYEKPVRGIGFFKVEELVEIAQQLDIECYDDHGKRLNKTDLYAHIYSTINSFFSF